MTRNASNLRSILQRWLELVDRRIERNQPTHNTSNSNNLFTFNTPGENLFSSGLSSSNTYSNNRNYRQSPVSTRYNLRRRRPRSIPSTQTNYPIPTDRNRTTRRRRNILNQILETTLYTPTLRQPASTRDISRNVTNLIWRDISNSTDQNLCPITQEEFNNNDRVSRIDNCGHLFFEDALNTYLTQFDHRCPICRYNISSEIYPPRSYADAVSRQPSQPISRQNAFDMPSFDLSYNLQTFPGFSNSSNVTSTEIPNNLYPSWDISNNNTLQFDFNNLDLNSAVNQISTAMLSSLSSALTNPDNSGNVIAAEYSLFMPTTRTRVDNSTNTEDISREADTDDETY